MATVAYDLITVGGGLGGSSVAYALAKRGARVLVLEREQSFSDRVRGEALAPWGVAELRALGLDDRIRATCGHELPWFDLYYQGALAQHRNIVSTTPQATGWLAFYHPAMQETLMACATEAGAEVRRGVRVREVRPGSPPVVLVEHEGRSEEIAARLVVCADGRGSLGRKWCGFTTQREAPRHLFSGLLFDRHSAPPDTSVIFFAPETGRVSLLFPQGGGRVRAYVGYHRDADPPAAAGYDIPRFIAEAVGAGVPAEWYGAAQPAGPLAMFDASDNWVDHPYREGVALVGDAAATSDPTWGQGMSLTLRDVRILSELLAAHTDWDQAGHAYAAAHDGYAAVVRTADDWSSELFLRPGEEAQQRRMRVLPLLTMEPELLVDVQVSGPDVPIDEAARRRLFGEE